MLPSRSAARVFAQRYVIAFGVAAVFMVVSVLAVNYVIDRKLDKIHRIKVATAPSPPNGANYLLIGSDTRAFVHNAGEEQAFGGKKETSGQRSDTMMVVHVEPGAKRTLAVSFPRDLWVDIPGQGMSKINGAFNSGPNKVIETLKSNFGIEINHYLEVDFKSFQGIVRAIGSVPTYFPYPARDLKTNLGIRFPGCARLDGPTALAYVRSRALEYLNVDTNKWVSADVVPDISRIARQQSFIRGLAGLAVAKSLNDPLTANEIADRVVENLKVDQGLSKDEIFSIVEAFRAINPDDQSALDMRTFPWEAGPEQGGQSVLYPKDPDWRATAALLQDFSGDTAGPRVVEPSNVKVRVLNATGVGGTAKAALREFVKLGFERGGTGNDPRGTIGLTEVRYRPGAEEAGKLVLSYIQPAARLVADPELRGVDVALVLGSDFAAVVTSPSTGPSVPTGGTPSSPAPSTSGGVTPIAGASQLGEPAPKKPPC
jgi:LCP family protein required for cell wall assembly